MRAGDEAQQGGAILARLAEGEASVNELAEPFAMSQPAVSKHREGGTVVTTVMDYGTQASRDAALGTGMTDGMEASYRRLDGVLAEGPTA